MAVTTEPGLRGSAVLTNKAITHEDFLDALDRIEPAATPFMSMCPNEVNLKAVDRMWNVDQYPSPAGAIGRGDGEAASTGNARDWTTNIRKMGNVMQGFSETWRIGWITQMVPKIAGVDDPVAYSKAGAYEIMKRAQEIAFCSFDQVAEYDAGAGLGSIMAGYYQLVASANAYSAFSAFAVGKPTDKHSAPASAVLTGSLSANHSRSMWKNVALALRQAVKQNTDWTLIAGLNLKQAISDLTDPVTFTGAATGGALAAAAQQVRVLNRAETDSNLGVVIDIIQTPNGRFFVVGTDWTGTTTGTVSGTQAVSAWAATTAGRAAAVFSAQPYAGMVIDKRNVWKCWGIPPYTEQLGKDGGGDTYDSKCALALGVRNPIRAGALYFTAA